MSRTAGSNGRWLFGAWVGLGGQNGPGRSPVRLCRLSGTRKRASAMHVFRNMSSFKMILPIIRASVVGLHSSFSAPNF